MLHIWWGLICQAFIQILQYIRGEWNLSLGICVFYNLLAFICGLAVLEGNIQESWRLICSIGWGVMVLIHALAEWSLVQCHALFGVLLWAECDLKRILDLLLLRAAVSGIWLVSGTLRLDIWLLVFECLISLIFQSIKGWWIFDVILVYFGLINSFLH